MLGEIKKWAEKAGPEVLGVIAVTPGDKTPDGVDHVTLFVGPYVLDSGSLKELADLFYAETYKLVENIDNGNTESIVKDMKDLESDDSTQPIKAPKGAVLH